jgi:two-component system, LytTR family, response regulator
MQEPIRVLIVDDERLGRERVRELLAHEENVELVGECCDGLQAVEAIEAAAPDVVFLDVQMPELNGFEVVEAVSPERCPHLVFVTAYDKYMERAFEVHAVDYLRKPYLDERFHAAFRYVRERVEERRGRDTGTDTTLLARLQELIAHSGGKSDRLIIRDREKGDFRVIRAREVEAIEAADGLVHVHVGKVTHPWRTTLADVERRLDPRAFLRVHRARIVNMQRIQAVSPLWKGEYVLVLESGRKVSTGRKYQEAVEAFLQRT